MSTPQIQGPQAAPPSTSTAPRKRRRRAPATGAADDCFTCASRSLKCDRRRPYCSQCLDDGETCSGYKTTLTWGVGVASRGKLRGLSLPIAGGQKAASPESRRPDRKRKLDSDADATAQSVRQHPTEATQSSSTSNVASSTAQRHEPRTAPINIPNNISWHHQPSPISTSIPPRHVIPFGDHVSQPFSATSRGPSANDQRSPHLYTPSPQDASYFGSPIQDQHQLPPNFQSYYSSNEHSGNSWIKTEADIDVVSFPTSAPMANGQEFTTSIAGSMSNLAKATTAQEGDEEAIDDTVYGSAESFIVPQMSLSDHGSPMSASLFSEYALSLSPFTGMTSIGKTPRIRYLINYYAEVISPVIVAFDSPSNPYRTHILQLAAGSETLQHAISALSASNLRQRRGTGALSTGKTDPARRSSMAHLSLTDASWLSTDTNLTVQDAAREESFHKAVSIQSLNSQLANPMVRKDDSILATLLILCLFHICDSGIAKFKTQFAGVKKLLSLRGSDINSDSRRTKWFTRMFTWFDAMTATVNDREGQLGEVHLDMSALSDEEWALENLAGCDGRLFKTIAKLGRLNVLSQGQTVDSSPRLVSRPFPVVSPYANFDGNGWSQVLDDEDISVSKQSFHSKSAGSDIQAQFWNEWRDIRHELQTWSLDTSLFDSSSSEASQLSAEQRLDLANISESFRYSALLYTERLASPTAASCDANIQAWVQQSLAFIKLVKSDVFLLWPLFITGSECATEEDRDLIRERCVDIQKDSGFFNNQSCLELLEKVWTANPPSITGQSMKNIPRTGGFKFSDIMRQEKNEGEYIVV